VCKGLVIFLQLLITSSFQTKTSTTTFQELARPCALAELQFAREVSEPAIHSSLQYPTEGGTHHQGLGCFRHSWLVLPSSLRELQTSSAHFCSLATVYCLAREKIGSADFLHPYHQLSTVRHAAMAICRRKECLIRRCGLSSLVK
jgi:hypothetical protein